jgi:hypothetical protein
MGEGEQVRDDRDDSASESQYWDGATGRSHRASSERAVQIVPSRPTHTARQRVNARRRPHHPPLLPITFFYYYLHSEFVRLVASGGRSTQVASLSQSQCIVRPSPFALLLADGNVKQLITSQRILLLSGEGIHQGFVAYNAMHYEFRICKLGILFNPYSIIRPTPLLHLCHSPSLSLQPRYYSTPPFINMWLMSCQ